MPAAMNFISGGSPLGSSVVSSAANKIVGFQRGAAAVAAKPPDLASIIKTLSTNILNNVENKVQSINQNVQQFVQGNFNKQLGEYRERLQSVDNDAPNKILRNFLSLYKDAIGYIQFLGNRRNVQQLGENLKSLQLVFSETFQVAKIIRQTIVRIVKQLSNLPRSSGSGGSGIDLDIKVPGGPLRKALPSRRNMLKMAGIAGVVGGAGMLGSKVVSGMMDTGGQISAVPTDSGQGLSGPLLDRFNAVLDRFDSAISRLAKPRSSTSSEGPSSGSDTAPTKEPSKPGTTSPGGTASTDSLKGNNNAEKVYNQLIAEGFTPEAASGVIGNLMQESGVDPTKKQYGGGPGRGIMQWGTGKGSGERYDRLTKWAEKNGKDPLALETQYQYMMMEMRERGTYGRLKGIKDVNKATDLFEKEMEQAGTPMMENRYKFAQSALKQYGSGTLQPGKPGVAGKPGEQGTPGKPGVSVAETTQPKVEPAKTQQETQQIAAQSVSQPPATQSKSQVNVVPLNMSSPQTQSTPVGQKVPPPPVLSKGGATVPFLTSTNHDNFMTLYSKIVYNLVD